VLSDRGLCDELITRPEESYRLWCDVVCDLEKLKNEEAMTRVGSQRYKKEKVCSISGICRGAVTAFVLLGFYVTWYSVTTFRDNP
jgi:hypothetical protein